MSQTPSPFQQPYPYQSAQPVCIHVDDFVAEAIRTGRPLNISSLWYRSYALIISDYWTFFAFTQLAILCMSVPILNFIILAGLYYYYIGRIRGQQRELQDMFIGLNQMTKQLIFAGLLTFILSNLGFLLLILPGVYLCMIGMFSSTLIIDKRLQFRDAMKVSRKIVHHNFGSILLLCLVNSFMILVGFLACFVGIYFVVMFMFAMTAFAYEDLFSGVGQTHRQPELTFQKCPAEMN